jgi:hypothetical protein
MFTIVKVDGEVVTLKPSGLGKRRWYRTDRACADRLLTSIKL